VVTSIVLLGSFAAQAGDMRKEFDMDGVSEERFQKAVAESLAALRVLHEQGVLSDEEYKQKQREIIDGGLSTGRKQDAAADGKAVAETLAALKVLHGQGVLSDEEYMRKQREVINEHTRTIQTRLRGDEAYVSVATVGATGEKEVSESIPPIAVAVFPFGSSIGLFNEADHLLPEFAHQYISENRQLRFLATYFKDKDSKIGGKTDYWSAANQPLTSRIYGDGARIDADAVLMYSYSGNHTRPEKFDVTVYLFDVKNRRTYQSSGNQNNYKRVTESLFKKITAIQ
jgi:hypothetical protein